MKPSHKKVQRKVQKMSPIYDSSDEEDEIPFLQTSKYDKPITEWMVKPVVRMAPMPPSAGRKAILPVRSPMVKEVAPVAAAAVRKGDEESYDSDSSLSTGDEFEFTLSPSGGEKKPPNKGEDRKPAAEKRGASKRKAIAQDGPQVKKARAGETVKEMVKQQRDESPQSVPFDAVGNNRNKTKSLRTKYVKKESTYEGEWCVSVRSNYWCWYLQSAESTTETDTEDEVLVLTRKEAEIERKTYLETKMAARGKEMKKREAARRR